MNIYSLMCVCVRLRFILFSFELRQRSYDERNQKRNIYFIIKKSKYIFLLNKKYIFIFKIILLFLLYFNVKALKDYLLFEAAVLLKLMKLILFEFFHYSLVIRVFFNALIE